MRTRHILICVLLLALLLSGCSQSDAQEAPGKPALQTEPLPVETAAPTEPAPLYPPAPVVEVILPLEHDPNRQEASVETTEHFTERFDGSMVRRHTEYVHDQNGKLLEERTHIYDSLDTLLVTTIRKYDESERMRDQDDTAYRADGTVSSGVYTIFDDAGRELLKQEFAYEEDGSLRYDNSYRYEYDADGNPVRTVSRHNPGGNAPSAREVYYGTAGTIIEESAWAFYGTGSVKSWSHKQNAEDGMLLEDHRMQFLADGTLSMERLSRFAQSGAQLEAKELSCYENGVVHYDFHERYTESGVQLENSRIQYTESGALYFLHKQLFNEDGKETFFHHEQFFADGSPESKHLKEYDENRTLRKQEYFSYYAPGIPATISYIEYDADGNLVKQDTSEYHSDGSLAYESKYPSEGIGDFVSVKKNTFYTNNNPEFVCDALYDTAGKIMEGKAVRYYENGQPWVVEEASFEETSRTRTSTETHYNQDGTLDVAWQNVEVCNEAGLVIRLDTTTHRGEDNSIYRQCNLYTYDEKGNTTQENLIILTAEGVQESRQERRYTYSDEGKLVGKELAQYDADDALTYHNTEEYDDAGLLLRRTTDLANSRMIEEYTYHADGNMHTLMTTIIPQETEKEPVIQYRKVTEEYYENGVKKSQTTQTWTSKDEKKAAPDTPQSALGKTYIVHYDESGNRI